MKRKQLVQKLEKEAKAKGLPFEVNTTRGKGGHWLAWCGTRRTTIQSGEITPGMERTIRKQLGL